VLLPAATIVADPAVTPDVEPGIVTGRLNAPAESVVVL
jgi:hypothetical protein